MGRVWRIEYEGAKLFNMSYSDISHSVKIFKGKVKNDKKVKNQFEEINSQFKL